MPANPPENMPRITPYLLYEDVAAALDWPKTRKDTTGISHSTCETWLPKT